MAASQKAKEIGVMIQSAGWMFAKDHISKVVKDEAMSLVDADASDSVKLALRQGRIQGMRDAINMIEKLAGGIDREDD